MSRAPQPARPAGDEDARRVRRAGSPTSHGGKQPSRRARGLAPSGIHALSAAPRRWICGAAGWGPGRGQPQRRRSRRGPSPPAPRSALPAPAPPRRCPARSLRPGPSPAAGGGAERGGAAVSTRADVRLRLLAPSSRRERLAPAPPLPGARGMGPLSLCPACAVRAQRILYPSVLRAQSPMRALLPRTAARGNSSKLPGPRPPAPPLAALAPGSPGFPPPPPPVTWISFS